jgi:NTP pyrophosphatase (non-canonical NTP hydrolase)
MTSSSTRKPIVVLPPDVAGDGAVSLAGYQRAVRQTDRLPPDALSTPILGLFGEIGSLLAVIKKKRRDTVAYTTYDEAILEELGDVLWYLTCIVSRAGLDLSVLSQRVFRSIGDWDEVQPQFGTWGDVQRGRPPGNSDELSLCMSELAELAGELVGDLRRGKLEGNRDILSGDLVALLRALVSTAAAADIDLDLAARGNLEKTFSRWPLERRYPALTDLDVPTTERLPRRFEVVICEHQVNGKTYVMQERNGVVIGDRLTDNKRERDDYRFHDVFHIAYAVHLGWSPVLRALFRVKRKSRPELDESEDGARAILIEEGIATFIFGRALERRLFHGLDHLDYDLLKLVQGFVRGFEPEHCAPWQWEQAILDGFRMFRELKRDRRGRIVADLQAHTLEFQELEAEHVHPVRAAHK